MSLAVTDQDKVEYVKRRITALSRSMVFLSSSGIIKHEGTKVKSLLQSPEPTSQNCATSRGSSTAAHISPSFPSRRQALLAHIGLAADVRGYTGLHVSYPHQAETPLFSFFIFSTCWKMGGNPRLCHPGARDSAAAPHWKYQHKKDRWKSSAKAPSSQRVLFIPDLNFLAR